MRFGFGFPGARNWRRIGAAGVILMLVGGGAVAQSHDHGGAVQAGFPAAMEAAMARMHADMAVGFTGDADRDFARMMIPHHQGAIDMAVAELRYGRDERLRRLAQEIVVDQQQEIALMHLVLGDPLPPGVPAPTAIPRDRPEH
jgi:hypothetical protein